MRETLDGVNARLQKFLDVGRRDAVLLREGEGEERLSEICKGGCLDWRVARWRAWSDVAWAQRARTRTSNVCRGSGPAASMPSCHSSTAPSTGASISSAMAVDVTQEDGAKNCACANRDSTRGRRVGRKRGDLRVGGRAKYAFANHAASSLERDTTACVLGRARL